MQKKAADFLHLFKPRYQDLIDLAMTRQVRNKNVMG